MQQYQLILNFKLGERCSFDRFVDKTDSDNGSPPNRVCIVYLYVKDEGSTPYNFAAVYDYDHSDTL